MNRSGWNDLTVEAYSSGTTRITDPRNELAKAQNENHNTAYPGGLSLDASFRIHRNIVENWSLEGAQRVVIRNGLTIVYEGYVNDLVGVLEQAGQYVEVPLVGAWSKIMMSRRWRKRWADDRVSDDVWVWTITDTGEDKCHLDRTNRLRFVPKAEAWGAGQLVSVRFAMPTGEVFHRIAYDYDFSDNAAAQDWQIEFYDAVNGLTVIANADGSAADQSYEPGTAVNATLIRYRSIAGQTPTSDGTYYGEVSNLIVFGGEDPDNNVDLTQIAKDVLTNFTDLNSSTSNIATITQTTFDKTYGADQITGIVPFVMDDFPTLADILTDMAGYGDDSQNAWACGLLHSESVAAPDGKPVLFVEQQPVLTSHDYAVSLDDPNLTGSLAIAENYDDLYNWIAVEYIDENGWVQYVTPDNDANLKDTTSITDYDQRDYVLNVGDATLDSATDYGLRFLAKHKDPQWKAHQPVQVTGYIRKDDGSLLPSSQIRAGKRLKIENYLNDLSGTGLTLLITGTQYDDDSETCSMTFGRLDDFFIAPFAHPPQVEDTAVGSNKPKPRAGSRGPTPPWVKAIKLGYVSDFKAWCNLPPSEKRRIKKEMGY